MLLFISWIVLFIAYLLSLKNFNSLSKSFNSLKNSCDVAYKIIENYEKLSGYKEEPKKLLKIGELAKLTNKTVTTIRKWTVKGLLIAEKKSSGRMYGEEMIQRVKEIEEMRSQKMSLTEIKERLNEN